MTKLKGIFTPSEPLNVWQWNERHTDFSLVPSHETRIKTRFDPDLMPLWKEPCEAATDPTVREIIICKCARALSTESVPMNIVRYHVAHDPLPILLVGADEKWTELFFKKRIVPGLRAARPCAELFTKASVAGTRIEFEYSDLTADYAGSRSIAKGFGYSVVIGTEYSMWRQWAADMLRKRLATDRYGHLILESSPDPQQSRPSSEDPVFIEFYGNDNGEGASDQRFWYMPEPTGRGEFKYEAGDPEQPWGLKWSPDAKRDDGTWNLSRVGETAHYVTPGGSVITNAERMKYVRRGRWVPENADRAVPGKRGYHCNAFYTPLAPGDFGQFAVDMLKAIAKGPDAHRVFAYESEARRWYGDKTIILDDALTARAADYGRGERMTQAVGTKNFYIGRPCITTIQVDVQHVDRPDPLYWMACEWVRPGDCGIVDFGSAATWGAIADMRARYSAAKCVIDASYAERRNEVFEQCLWGDLKGAVPMFGRDSLDARTGWFRIDKERDPFEGTARQGKYKLPMVTFNPNSGVGNLAWRMINGVKQGNALSIYRTGDALLSKHFANMECVDGLWTARRDANHGWDCFLMGIVIAHILDYFREVPDSLDTAQPAPVVRRKVGVFTPR